MIEILIEYYNDENSPENPLMFIVVNNISARGKSKQEVFSNLKKDVDKLIDELKRIKNIEIGNIKNKHNNSYED